jgi:hypothetical protein
MPTDSQVNDPAHWRQRAEEARRIAAQLDDPVASKAMLDIARSYDAMANLAGTRPLVRKP